MPWDPIRDLQAWHERLASPHAEAWTPATDVYETAAVYVITAELPGLGRDQVELELEASRLTIRGRRHDHPRAAERPVRYHQIERGRGPFSRTFEFADKVDAARVSANLSDGVLTVTLPKLPEAPARVIVVR